MSNTKQQQELVRRLYWKPAEKVWVYDRVNNHKWPAVVESECVTMPGWVWVREGAVGNKPGQLHRVRAETLEERHA